MSNYNQQLIELIKPINSPLQNIFLKRLNQQKISRTENPASHFCCFFAPIDIQKKQVFIGLHKKSGLWLFNGGHIEKDELPLQTMKREMSEEWGYIPSNLNTIAPEYISYAQIENPSRSCKEHFDVWYFIKIDQNNFHPDEKLLIQEFSETRWMDINTAKTLCNGQYSYQALEFIEQKYFK